MPLYEVTWTFEIEADDEVDAAHKAVEVQRDKEVSLRCFEVKDIDEEESVTIDLLT